MKREITVFSLLLTIILASIINIAYANRISSQIIDEINRTEAAGTSGQFQQAMDHLDSALQIWDKHKVYTGIFLRHPDIDSAYDCFYEVQAELLDENTDTLPAVCSKLRYHIECIANMEKLKLSSIL